MNTVHDILKQFDRLSKAELAMISETLLKSTVLAILTLV